MAWGLLIPLSMKPRIIATALVGSMLGTLPAAADRGRRVAQARQDQEKDGSDRDDQDGPEATKALAINIDQLIEVAVRLAPDLARSRQDRLTAKGQADASRRDQQWVVSAGAQLEHFATDPNNAVAPFQTVGEDKTAGNLGVARNIPTGGNVGLEFSIIRSARELAIPEVLQPDQAPPGQPIDTSTGISDEVTEFQAQAKLTFRQPLARGFGSKVALAPQRKADLAMVESTVRTQLAAEEMIRDIVVGYWELANAAYEVETRVAAIELAKEQEKQIRLEIRADQQAKTQLSAVLFELSTREEALLEAKNQYEKKSLDLRKKVGLELSKRDIVMRPLEKFEVGDKEFTVEEALERARKGNRQVAALILAKRQAEVDVDVAKNGMLPQVDLTLSGAMIGGGSTADKAFTASADGNNFVVTAGLSVQFEIGGAAKGQHDAAVARRRRVEIDQLDAQRTLETEIVHAVHQVASARARAALADKAITHAENNVRSERGLFTANQSTAFNVMQRQDELIQSRLRRGRAIADYHIAVAQVQFLGGTLLDAYQIDVRPPAKK